VSETHDTTPAATADALALSRSRAIAAQCAGVLLAPVAWFVQFQINYALVVWTCAHGSSAAHYLVTLAFLAAAAGGGLLSWRGWRDAGASWQDDGGGAVARSRFLAGVGMLGSALFFLVILAQGIAALVISPCQP
jgi:hypothetical protein